MTTRRTLHLCRNAILCTLGLMLPAVASAQQVTVGTPYHNFGDSFYENFGIGFGFNLRGYNVNGPGTRVVGLLPNGQFVPGGDIQFRQGSFGAAVPTMGGFNPAAGATGGFAVGGRGGDAFFNFAAGQGRTTTHTMEAPMVTVMNGQPGSFSDQMQTPFVTGVTPIVGGMGGGFSMPPVPTTRVSPLLERVQRMQAGERGSSSASARSRKAADKPAAVRDELEDASASTAGQPALSIAEIQRQRASGQSADGDQQEARKLLEHGRQAAEAGKAGVAKIFYRQAIQASTGELRAEAEKCLQELSPPSAAR